MATTRRLFTQGNSLVMVITRDVAAHLGVSDGDMIELFKEPRKRITLRKYHETERRFSPPRPPPGRGWGASS